jgi:hypothetical protein
MPENDGVIEFGKQELDPEKSREYAEKIRKARTELPMSSKDRLANLKGHTPVGVIERPKMPNLQEAANTPARGGGSGIAERLQQGVQPRPPGSPVVTRETAEQIKDLAEAQKQEPPKEEQKKAEEKKTDDDLSDLLDFGNLRTEAERIHKNKKRKETIERRCEKLVLAELIWKGELKQIVPIVPGEFEVTYRTISADENLFVRKFVSREKAADAYLLDLYTLCQLTCSLVSIAGGGNVRALPDHLNSNGEVDEKAFNEKLGRIRKMPIPLIADLLVNYDWFDVRTRKVLNSDELGNG